MKKQSRARQRRDRSVSATEFDVSSNETTIEATGPLRRRTFRSRSFSMPKLAKKRSSSGSSRRSSVSAIEVAEDERLLCKFSLTDLVGEKYLRKGHVHLKYPYVLYFLIDSILEHGGLEAEGIFRLSIATNEKHRCISLLNSGIYDLKTKNPYTYAVLLKEFLVSTREPLIDYESATKSKLVEQKAGDLFASMSQVHQESLKAVFRLIRTFDQPHVVAQTLMKKESLLMILTAALLRPPADVSSMDVLRFQQRDVAIVTSLYDDWNLFKICGEYDGY